jgi:DNA-binding NarL/FixJ family response regulator
MERLLESKPMRKNSTKNRIKVLLAEDHAIVREGLRKLLEAEGDFEITGEAENGRAVVDMTAKLRPDVVVMDIAMPQLNGLEATRQILRAQPNTRILVLSAHSDDAYIEHLNAVGAAGYLIKQTSSHILAKAIREVVKGNTFFGPSIERRLQGQKASEPATGKKHVARLSSREMEVLQLIAEGQANKQIAEELKISVKTVEKHRQNVMNKLSIHDTAGLTRYAISAGIIESSVQLTIV